MKRTALLLATTVLLAGCSHFNSNGSAGNPGGSAYAGEEGSVFDANAGPNRPVRPDVYERQTPEQLLPPSLATGGTTTAPSAPMPPPPAPAPAR